MNYVINADDFGMDKDTSAAIIKAFMENRINRTSAMVNMSDFEESCRESFRKGFASSVGLHLNLTKGTPLTEKIKQYEMFCDQDGCFNGKSMQSNFFRLFPLSKDIKKAVYEEIDAQFRKYLDCYGQKGANHMDSHHHVHKNLNILPLCISIAQKYGFQSMRFAKTSGSFVNCCYNKVVNHKIRKGIKQQYYELFDSVRDFTTRRNYLSDRTFFEVECHPIEKNGVLYDGDIALPLLEHYKIECNRK